MRLPPEREHGRAHPHGLFGRKAGSVGDFVYSPAMKASVIWNEETLAKYICDLKAFPGSHMAFPGIKNDKEFADLPLS